MKFTLVTTCLNEMSSLAAWLEGIRRQTRQPDEVAIVDGGSTDGTIEALGAWARDDSRVKVRVENCTAARGRNLAIAMARHEHVISTDMGVSLDPKWIEEMARPFEADESIDVVIGSYGVDASTIKTAAARAEHYIEGEGSPFWIRDGEAALRNGVAPSNRSVAYTKKLWRELGGLPEDLTRCADDSVFGRQILQSGCRMAFAPLAMVYWQRHRSLKQFWREQYAYGRGDGEAGIKAPAAFRLFRRRLLPRALVAPLTGLRTLTKQIKPARLWRALRKGDLLACACMPVLSFGNGYRFAKGYLVGHEYGNRHCLACRARLGGRGQEGQ